MSRVVIVHVDDEEVVRRYMVGVFLRFMGLPIVQFESVRSFRDGASAIEAEQIVLITDGNLKDGICADVVMHAIQAWGIERLGRTAMVFSASQQRDLQAVMDIVTSEGLAPHYIRKPANVAEFKAWWDQVRSNFGL